MDAVTNSDATAWVAGHERRGDEFRSLDADGPLGVAGRIVEAAETPADGAVGAGIPVLHRGDARIIPLSWQPPEGGDGAVATTANDLWAAVRSACEYRHGTGLSVDLHDDSAPDGYGRELARTGVRRADWWESDTDALVLVVHGPPLPARPTASALHVVPIGWVSDRRRSRRVRPGDLSWSRRDVTAALETDTETRGARIAWNPDREDPHS